MATNNRTVANSKNAIKNAANNSISTDKRPNNSPGLRGIVKQMEGEIKKALVGTALNPERFTRLIISTISSNERLAASTPESFCAAMMSAAQLGLEPNTALGQAYLIPYYNSRKRAYETQFQLGYRGLLELAYRSGQITSIRAESVYENDEFDYQLGWDQKLEHKPALKDRGEVIGYYALFKTDKGGGNFFFMSKEDIEAHARKFSSAFNSRNASTRGPWESDFDSMAKKTVLKQLLKYAPIRVELSQALTADEATKNIDLDRIEEVNVLDEVADYSVEIGEEPVEEETSSNKTNAPKTKKASSKEVAEDIPKDVADLQKALEADQEAFPIS